MTNLDFLQFQLLLHVLDRVVEVTFHGLFLFDPSLLL